MAVTVTIAKEQAKRELHLILSEAGLVDGLVKENSSKIKYWQNNTPRTGALDDTYLTWNILSTNNEGSADNKPRFRFVFIALDLFTKKNPDAKQLNDLIKKIELSALKYEWRFEESSAAYYEIDTDLMHYSFNLEKKIY